MLDSMEIEELSKLSKEPRSNDHRLNPSNSQSLKHNQFQLSDLPLHNKPKRNEFWFPEQVTPWFFLESYASLPETIKIRYNQLYALGNQEAFIGLELDFLCPILTDILKNRDLPSAFAESLEHFLDEENKHAEMFRLVNQTAEPEMYRNRKYFLTDMEPKKTLKSLRRLAKYYRYFGVWIWIGVFFEERTVMYSREYLRAKNPKPCELFTTAHKLHMLEEVHHLQLDEELMAHFYSPLSFMQKKLSAWMLKSVINAYLQPKKMSLAIARVLREEYPDKYSHSRINACIHELPALKSNKEFRRQFFGLDITRRFRRLLANFPEMNSIIKMMDV